MFYSKFSLPGPSASDVATQELTVRAEGFDPQTAVYDATADKSEEFKIGEAGSVCRAELVDIDKTGNRSEARTIDFTIVDTIAPPMPGEFGALELRQD